MLRIRNFLTPTELKWPPGRKFSKTISTDDSLAFIINESAAKEIGWKNLQENINREFQYAGTNGKLIGIVKDFHFESLHQRIAPMVFLQRNGNYNSLSVKISANTMQEGITQLEKTWKSFLPGRPFEYSFVSERYRDLYQAEQKQSQLFTTFSGLAIFIASLGLFGSGDIQYHATDQGNWCSQSIGCIGSSYSQITINRNCNPDRDREPHRVAGRLVFYEGVA